ncbi:MAG: hypothetical protein K5839_06885 [Treponemataceae bacterium]|nr:hypothetical protein [Treponemataceae bacterium]
MKNTLTAGFTDFFASFGKALLLLLLCLAASFVIVFPFWLFADKAPSVYTIVCLSILSLLIITLIVLSLLKKFRGKTSEEKKIAFHNLWRSLLIFFICLISIVLPVVLVLLYYRLAALIVFVLGFVSLGLVSFCVKKK